MSHAFQTGFIMGAAFCIPAAVIAYAVGYDHAMKVAKKLRQISFDRELRLHRVAARSGN